MQHQYQTFTDSSGCFSLVDQSWIEIRGGDAIEFMQRMLTADIQGLGLNQGIYSCLCTNKGRIVSDMDCYRFKEGIDILCAKAHQNRVIEHLTRYRVTEDVTFQPSKTEWGGFALIGATAREMLQGVIPDLPQSDFQCAVVSAKKKKFWVNKRPRWSFDGYEVWGAAPDVESLKSRLSVLDIDLQTQEILRIESATPKYGVDMDESNIPQEAGLHHALNFEKGCYIGQETIARVHYRGHVNKELALLKIEGQHVPPAQAKIFTEDDKEAGWITSACISPQYQSSIALGYIKYTYREIQEFKVEGRSAQRVT